MDFKRALLRTKFFMLPVRADAMARPRLEQRLEEGLLLGRPLTLVSAPAGYGKTTLIASWLRRREVEQAIPPAHVAWVSLDDTDNDPSSFFAYVISAIQESGIAWQPSDQALWDLADSLPVEAIIASLLNETGLPARPEPLVLVLDDYHKIHSTDIHEALQLTLNYAPPALRVIVITREDPPLTLARWRAQGRLTEIRAADLRFSRDEAEGFLNQTMALNLPAGQLAALEERTEGWIAGLQLAALALNSQRAGGGQSDQEFIASFSGSHRYVIDYLLEEVLRRQDETVRDFLQQTSPLDRLCASLCNAVTGRDDSQIILQKLERANLFLIPLDDRREWYRYHQLMADSLQAGLDRSVLETTHRRAAQWYEAQELPAEAVHHAFATGDMVLAADVLEHVIQKASTWSRGQLSRLTGWLDSLPDSALADRPALCLHASRALYLSGRMEQAEALLRQAELTLRQNPAAAHGHPELPTQALIYRAAIDAMRGENLIEAAATMRHLLSHSEGVGHHITARAADTLGLACEMAGDVDAAEQAYRYAADLAQAAGVSYLAVNARCEAALVQIQQGRLALAAETCRAALALVGEADIPPAGLAWAILGEIARECDDLATASRHVLAGIDLAQKGGIVDDLRFAYVFLARLRQAQGDPTAALAAWHRADSLIHSYRVARLTQLSAAHRARLDLAQGNIAQAERWAAEYRLARVAHAVAYLREFEDLTLARVLLWGKKSDDALDILRPLAAAARDGGRNRTVIEAHVLQAIAQSERDDRAADASLTTAISLAAPEGFARLFLDEGPALAPLLARVRHIAPEFVDQLLTAPAAGEPASVDSRPDALTARSSPLLEPLSNRELEVLRLLAAGLSNQEIAGELVISVGTAKWHAHNIFAKLGVRGRTQAIARAREWQLI